MTDDEFLHAFTHHTIHEFRHRDHLRLAWLQVRHLGPEGAAIAVTEGIRQFAAAQGVPDKYHDTMTRFWVALVAHAVAQRPEIDAFDRFLDAYPWLLEKDLPFRHWRRETMMSAAARAGWVAPDVVPMPA